MKYWLTTHYPPTEDGSQQYPPRIWLQDGKESAGSGLAAGDHVLIYEFKTGPIRWIVETDGKQRKAPRRVGKEGVIVVAEVTGPLAQDRSFEKFEHNDGTIRWWCWYCPLALLDKNGYVSRIGVNQALGHALNNPLRSCGKLKSGLKELTEKQYQTLADRFRANAK